MATLCLLNLSSGENLAGWALSVTLLSGFSFLMYYCCFMRMAIEKTKMSVRMLRYNGKQREQKYCYVFIWQAHNGILFWCIHDDDGNQKERKSFHPDSEIFVSTSWVPDLVHFKPFRTYLESINSFSRSVKIVHEMHGALICFCLLL